MSELAWSEFFSHAHAKVHDAEDHTFNPVIQAQDSVSMRVSSNHYQQ
jgi:hypothetical protein